MGDTLSENPWEKHCEVHNLGDNTLCDSSCGPTVGPHSGLYLGQHPCGRSFGTPIVEPPGGPQLGDDIWGTPGWTPLGGPPLATPLGELHLQASLGDTRLGTSLEGISGRHPFADTP